MISEEEVEAAVEQPNDPWTTETPTTTTESEAACRTITIIPIGDQIAESMIVA